MVRQLWDDEFKCRLHTYSPFIGGRFQMSSLPRTLFIGRIYCKNILEQNRSIFTLYMARGYAKNEFECLIHT
jgi:hypothetical protein